MFSIDGGRGFTRVLAELDEAGYDAEWNLLNSKNFGVPHNRERVFIVGHLRGRSGGEVFPIGRYDKTIVSEQSYKIICIGNTMPSGVKNSSVPGRVYDPKGISPCLRTPTGGRTIPTIIDYKSKKLRSLTPKECFRLQGFPDKYFERASSVNSNSQLYKQAGNGVTVNVTFEIGKKIAEIESLQIAV